jgi:ankyrin repeat protein
VLQAGADPAYTENADEKTSLWVACDNKHEAAAAELMEATKQAGALDLQSNHYKYSALHVASERGLGGTVAKLLSFGADATLVDSYYGRTPVGLSGSEDVKAAFVEHYAQVEITNENKNGLLLLCASLGIASRLPAVLQAGADVAHTDEHKNTCLHLAAKEGNGDVMRMLLKAGAKVVAKDIHSRTPFDVACNDEVKAVFSEFGR